MASIADMQVKIGADISELLSKVDAAKAKLNQLTESNQQLKVGIKDLTDSLRLNEKELGTTSTQLRKLVDSGKGATSEANKLRKEITLLSSDSQLLNKNLAVAKTQLAANTSELKLQTVAVKEAEKGTAGFAAGAGKAFSALRTLANIIPGIGIGGLVALIAGPVVDAFGDWFESINKVSDATRILKVQQDDLNDIMKDANKDAAKQTVDLQLLYGAATNVNLSLGQRLNAVKALQTQFPDYFANISKETILNGGAKDAYDALARSIQNTARTKAAISKLNDIEAKQLDQDFKKQQLLIDAGKKLVEIQKQGDKLQDVGAGVSVKVTTSQQEAAVNASLKFALQQIDIDNKILKERRDFVTTFVAIGDIAPSTGRLKEIDNQIAFLKSQKELNASTLLETKIFNKQIKDLQDERDKIDPPKLKTERVKKDAETIEDVLKKLAIQIDFLNQKEITLKVNQSNAKIAEIEKTIDTLLQKFHLLSDNPIIINLIGQINDIQLTEQFNKVLKGGGKNQKIEVPMEILLKMGTPTVEFPPGAFDEQILRDEILKKLKDLGVTKTVPVKIGIDITGSDIIAGSEEVGKNVSTVKLLATLKKAEGDFKEFNARVLSAQEQFSQSFEQIMSDTVNSSFINLGQAIGNAIGSGGDLGQAIFGSLLETLAAGIERLGEAMVTLGTAKIAIEKFHLAPGIGTVIAGLATIALGAALKAALPKFATGGEIKGAGTGTSDSIVARVSKGEYIVKASVVKQMGVGFFDKLNKGIKPINYEEFMIARGVTLPRFAAGGLVSPNNINLNNNKLAEINIGSQNIQVEVVGRVSGNDIWLSNHRTDITRGRNS